MLANPQAFDPTGLAATSKWPTVAKKGTRKKRDPIERPEKEGSQMREGTQILTLELSDFQTKYAERFLTFRFDMGEKYTKNACSEGIMFISK